MWIILALVAGYAFGRIRPLIKAMDWTEDQVTFYLHHWDTTIKRPALFLMFACTHPVRTWNAVRRKGEEA
jgi:hypothetical protein